MKVFVWNRIKQATNSYHAQGGVVVFAETEERARQLAAERGDVDYFTKEPACVIATNEKPDDVREVIGGKEAVYIMRDAGCC